MSNKALATLAVRLVGVWAWFQVVMAIPAIAQATALWETAGIPFTVVAIGYAALVFWIAAGFVLIFRSSWLTRLLLRDLEEPDGTPKDQGELQAILFSVVGLVVLAGALPEIAFLVTQYVWLHESEKSRETFLESQWAHGASLAVLVLVGVALFFGARGLSGIWHRIWRRLGEMNQAP